MLILSGRESKLPAGEVAGRRCSQKFPAFRKLMEQFLPRAVPPSQALSPKSFSPLEAHVSVAHGTRTVTGGGKGSVTLLLALIIVDVEVACKDHVLYRVETTSTARRLLSRKRIS